MGKLNIAHHKSYHPYRLDNIEKVRKDEEEARRKEEGEDNRMRLADSEARLDLLRARSGSGKKPKKKKGDDDEIPEAQPVVELTSISTSSGHINLFADIEQQAMSTALVRSREMVKKANKPEEEKGVALAPSKKDLTPWYSENSKEDDVSDEKRMKELSWKAASDPLTSIKSQLSRSYPSSTASSLPRPSASRSQPLDASQARATRESSERARAMELIRRRKREKEREALGLANMTPSSVGWPDRDNDMSGPGYGDVYNRKETEEAHRRWDRYDSNRERDRGRERRSSFQDRRREYDRPRYDRYDDRTGSSNLRKY